MIYSPQSRKLEASEKPPTIRVQPLSNGGAYEPPTSDIRSSLLQTETSDVQQHDQALAQRILQRIELRLPGRIRDLTVYTTENAVVLAGKCSTFYSKQLAQHIAMGVIEYEQLINNIDVRVSK